MRTILTTVGISLTSPNKHGGKTLNDQALANYLRHTAAAAASAETNSLSHILVENDNIVFLCSDTDAGKLCAEALRTYYDSMEYTASVKVIPHLTYKESKFKVQGLRSFVSTLINLVRTHKGSGEVLINATSGFKAEMAYAHLIGLLFNAPVFYIHEAFKDIIKMPAPPIGWDHSLIADCEEFFEWINDDYRKTDDANRRLSGFPKAEEIRFLLEEEDGFTLLSPTGEVFFEAFRERQANYSAIPISLSNNAQKTYNNADPNIKKLFGRTLRKLRDPQLRNNGSGQVDNCDCLVYPRGNRDERLFWFEGENGNPYVCELARHSDQSYESLIQEGVNKSKYQVFNKWNDPETS